MKVPHFSDKGVLLIDTLDCPAYSLAAEKVRLAFRAAYSIFDKIAFFLNAYLGLGIEPGQVVFRTLWYERDAKRGCRLLRSCFADYENWPMRGLFWLAKDLFSDDPDFREATAADARDLQEIRNRLEHRFLKLHEATPSAPGDELTWSVARRDFEEKTLRVLKLARAALIYLSLGMHREERLREQRQARRTATPVTLPTMPDNRRN
jgi:hypothetical protein